MKRILFHFLLVTIVLVACEPAERIVKLSPGKSVRIISVGNMYSAIDEINFLMIRYETEIDIIDVQDLRREAQEVWDVFRPTADSSGYFFAAVQANTPRPDDSPSAYTSRTYTHVIKKRDDGSWFFKSDEKAEQSTQPNNQ